MKYTIRELVAGSARVDFADGSWADVPVLDDDTKEVFDTRVGTYATKTNEGNPDWISTSTVGTVTQDALAVSVGVYDGEEQEPDPQWLISRRAEYGAIETQIEFITENGLDAWQTEVARIKTKFPQP